MPSNSEWRARQHRLNLFTSKYLKGVGKIRVDGEPGPATLKRIREAKFWLGYVTDNNGVWNERFHKSLLAPNDPKVTSTGTVARGKKRRRAHNVAWAKSFLNPIGVTTFDGVRVARWLVPYLKHARATGTWKGHLVSGWRDPAYSEKLCYHMCGRPSCPGKCAGRASNHAGSSVPRGAVDVSDYYAFGRAVHGWKPKNGWPVIFNALGAQDPVHFSASGR
jgi:hypothetical protein